jgi:chromate transport protein ChrA
MYDGHKWRNWYQLAVYSFFSCFACCILFLILILVLFCLFVVVVVFSLLRPQRMKSKVTQLVSEEAIHRQHFLFVCMGV